MGLSSRIAICLCAAALMSSSAADATIFARPGFSGMRPTIVARGPGLGVGRFLRPGLLGRRRSGYGLGGDGFGTLDYGAGGLAVPAADAGAYLPRLPPPFAFPVPPPPCPLIIEVGRGLAHRAKTRVVYGAPVCGR